MAELQSVASPVKILTDHKNLEFPHDHKAAQLPASTLFTIPLTIQLPKCIPRGKSQGKTGHIN